MRHHTTFRGWYSLAVATFTVLGSCSGGGGGGLGGGGLGSNVIDDGREWGGDAQSTSPYRETLTSDEAYHLMRRAAFGATPEKVAEVVSSGLTVTVDGLLEVVDTPAALETLTESFEDNLSKKWLVHLMEGPNPLHENIVLFWHDRFATSRRVLDGRDSGLAELHWQMIRNNALGNYRTFLQELTIDPLMLIWLDGANSPKQAPNENYAREFWELFTLGRDVLYTEDDIREGARAFTGITLLRESDLDARPIYDLLNHDETPKDIFPGRAEPGNYNYLSAIDLTLEQFEAAEYVARNLFVYFVHDHPSEATIVDLATFFADNDFEIAPLVRRILRSQAMFSEEARGVQISSPVQHIVGVARTLDMHAYSEDSQGYILDRLVDDLRGAGHELLNPPGVQGWGEDAFWLQDQWIISRAYALGRNMEYGPEHTAELPYHILPPTSRWTEREVRDEIVDAIAGAFHIPVSEEERVVYIEVLDQNGWLAFHLENPDYQPRQVYELIRLMAMDERVIGR